MYKPKGLFKREMGSKNRRRKRQLHSLLLFQHLLPSPLICLSARKQTVTVKNGCVCQKTQPVSEPSLPVRFLFPRQDSLRARENCSPKGSVCVCVCVPSVLDGAASFNALSAFHNFLSLPSATLWAREKTETILDLSVTSCSQFHRPLLHDLLCHGFFGQCQSLFGQGPCQGLFGLCLCHSFFGQGQGLFGQGPCQGLFGLCLCHSFFGQGQGLFGQGPCQGLFGLCLCQGFFGQCQDLFGLCLCQGPFRPVPVPGHFQPISGPAAWL